MKKLHSKLRICLKKTLLVCLMLPATFTFSTGEELKYGLPQQPWEETLGNHRAVLRVGADAGAAWFRLDWRRYDHNVDRHKFIILNASTGEAVQNIHRYAVNNEFCSIAFGPVVQGIYHFYYLPQGDNAGWSGYGEEFLKPEAAPSEAWLTAHKVITHKEELPEAACLEIQARTAFDSFWPMAVIATEAEKSKLKAGANTPFLLFPEDRINPIRMPDNIPQKWLNHPSPGKFSGTACRNEYYVFQIGLWAMENIEEVNPGFSDLEGPGGIIPASAFTCFNTSGIDPLGNPFTKEVNVKKDAVQALWIGIDLSGEAVPGIYRGKVSVNTANAGSRDISLELGITDEMLADRGDGELWRHSRLRWLNSPAGIDDNHVSPYQPIKYTGAQKLELTGKEVVFSGDGLPASIRIYGHELLSGPVRFSASANGVLFSEGQYSSKILKSAAGISEREYSHSDQNLDMVTRVTAESDGFLKYTVTLTAIRDLELSDVSLTIPFRTEISEYMMGMDLPGSVTPDRHEAKWNKPQDAFWMGNTLAGLHCELRGASYTGPLLNLYRPEFPETWHNGGQGGFRIETSGDTRNVTVYSGRRNLPKEEKITFEWAFLLTPVKPVNAKDHFTNRYYHNYPDPDPRSEELKDGFHGIKVINLHHANRYNPYINYPFLADDELKGFINRFHAMGIKAKIYYTIREVSNNMAEIWAMRSLGGEIFTGDRRGGDPWLQEHLVTGYSPSWFERIDSVRRDAAIVTATGSSRWYNYYIEGLKWMVRHYNIDGLYLDDVAYDRDMLKRMRKVMEAERSGCLIDLHSNTGFSIGPAIQYTGFFPYVDRLWFGEGFHYNTLSPAQWLVEVSGLPFGLMNDMLGVAGNSPWKGMVYGMTTRYPWGTVKVACNSYDIWKVWDSFGIGDARMTGYWDKNPAVIVSTPEVLATSFVKDKKMLISVANWGEQAVDALLEIDYKRAGIDPAKVRIHAPAIPDFQEGRTFMPGLPLPIEPSKGWLLVVEEKE
jgi:hypothetical protein